MQDNQVKARDFARILREESKRSHSVELSSTAAVSLASIIENLADENGNWRNADKNNDEQITALTTERDELLKTNLEQADKIKALESTIRSLSKKLPRQESVENA